MEAGYYDYYRNLVVLLLNARCLVINTARRAFIFKLDTMLFFIIYTHYLPIMCSLFLGNIDYNIYYGNCSATYY